MVDESRTARGTAGVEPSGLLAVNLARVVADTMSAAEVKAPRGAGAVAPSSMVQPTKLVEPTS